MDSVKAPTSHYELKWRSGGGDGAVPVQVGSTTTEHDELFLQLSDDREESLQLNGSDVSCRAATS